MSNATKVPSGVMALRRGPVGASGPGWGDRVYRFSACRRNGVESRRAPGPGLDALWGATDADTLSLPARRIGLCWRAPRAPRSVPIRREGPGVPAGLFLPLPAGRPHAVNASSRRGRVPLPVSRKLIDRSARAKADARKIPPAGEGEPRRGNWDHGRFHTDVRTRQGRRAVARKRLDRLTARKRPNS